MNWGLDTFTNLQGSQTLIWHNIYAGTLDTFTNLQGSQTVRAQRPRFRSLTPLRIYKVLKQELRHFCLQYSLTPLRIYKVLKLRSAGRAASTAWHLYEFTRFSNADWSTRFTVKAWHLYEFTRFSNNVREEFVSIMLDTFTNLQGSQTGSPTTSDSWCLTPLRIYKVLKLRDQVDVCAGGLTPLRIYKVLKLVRLHPAHSTAWHLYEFTRFSNHIVRVEISVDAWHLYEFTRFSNEYIGSGKGFLAWHLYEFTRFSNLLEELNKDSELDTFTNLQGSQTPVVVCTFSPLLDVYMNLQGSQTSK